ncbi:TFIIH subunit Tfb4/p34 [Naematelia encephala]|uniref:General transcription and DNA repair factor IIH subunit TFB4 n=1 Tax=Naematelia encephala TaxID=71784 RepID=A0A1Y2AW46_9TREE|nr:TFIIH subunit Tfb4/p34 [Naematelia encephala]
MANTMTQTHTIPLYPETTPASLLLVILDLHPLSWSILASAAPPPLPADATHKAPNTSLSLTEFINILVVFLNAHLAVRWGNQVVVYGASAGTSKLLYPTPPKDSEGSKPKPNMYAPFVRLDKTFESSLRGMFEEEQERLEGQQGKGLNDPPAIVSALTKALSYINRVAPHSPSSALTQPTNSDLELPNSSGADKLETRIMVINATPGSSSAETSETEGPKPPTRQSGGQRGGYVGMMNCVFAAQKAKVPIDVLTLPPTWTGSRPPIFLQQASHLTEGVYWRWNGRGGLLQYLHVCFDHLFYQVKTDTGSVDVSRTSIPPIHSVCCSSTRRGRLSCCLLLPP